MLIHQVRDIANILELFCVGALGFDPEQCRYNTNSGGKEKYPRTALYVHKYLIISTKVATTCNRLDLQLKLFSVGEKPKIDAVHVLLFFQKYPERAVYKVIHFMLRRGEIQHRMQRKMLYRVK